MLTADLVEVRRRGEILSLKPLEPDERDSALALADSYVGLVHAHVGRTRAQLTEALRLVPVSARLRRIAAGLAKLALDACTFEEPAGLDPPSLRAELFTEATRQRRALGPRADFDRAAVIAAIAARHDAVTPEIVEQALYADLPEAQVLVRADLPGPRALVATYEDAGVQAVLLRAISVRARVQGASPAAYRQLFRKLKFLRLLHTIEPLPAPKGKAATSPGYEITIDGPFSLFESVTRYGLALALAYPAIAACGRFVLEAELRWGKERRPLKFIQRGEAEAAPAETSEPDLPDEVAAVLRELERGDGEWKAQASSRLVALPGAGVIAPDLELVHAPSGRTVLVEVLGFWSRDAVWRRIELAEKGLPDPMVFAVSKHLRVSEAALPEGNAAALYVYAHKLSARALIEKATTLLRSPLPLAGEG